jgi:hypothetical protein
MVQVYVPLCKLPILRGFTQSIYLDSMGSLRRSFLRPDQCSGRILSITGQDPSISKSNRLHVDILWYFCIDLRYTQ